MQPRDNLSLLQTNTYTYTYTYWVLYTYTYEVLYTHTHTHTHTFILGVWLLKNSYVESMQLVFRLGTLGNENFGVLWNQAIVLWRNPLLQEEEDDTWVVVQSCFCWSSCWVHSSSSSSKVLTSRSFVTRLVCLSHTRMRRRIFDFRRSCFCPRVVTNRLLLLVGCWGQKESVLTCYDMTPLLLPPPPLWYFDQCAIISEEALARLKNHHPPVAPCKMNGFVKTGLQSDLVECDFDKH